MIKKLMIVLLSGAICLLAAAPLLAETNWGWSTLQEYEEATGNKIERFNEAPMLRLKVAAGELPPVRERLPEEPLVDIPEEIGTYGGTLRQGLINMFVWVPASLHTTLEYILNLDRKGEKVVPNIAKDWKFSDEGKTLTLYFRKGMKWSDGVPFTVDDLLFYWEGVILNDEITPVKPKQWMPGGELMRMEKVDDYTVSLHFSIPYWSVIWYFSGPGFNGSQWNTFLPQHALEKYHIDYNPEANELAEEAGYDYWWQLFNAKKDFLLGTQRNPEIPSLGPWVTKQILPEGVVWERNPYYYKIDTAGNQLPYIDKVTGTVFGDDRTLALKVVSGEYDYIDWFMNLSNYTLFMEAAEKGGYEVWLSSTLGGVIASLLINQNYSEDPVTGEILRNLRFRQALSLAINREEFNELFFFGLANPRQATVHPSCSFYKEEWGNAYIEYNPEEANKLLDEMGLDKRDKEGFRLKSDGETLLLVISNITDVMPVEWSEIIEEYWENVGVKTTISPVDRAYLMTLWAAGAHMISIWDFTSAAQATVTSGMNTFVRGEAWGPLWQTWWNTKGESGEEPPEQVKRMFSLYDEVPYLPEKERDEALTETWDIFAEGLWQIGVVGEVPRIGITSIDLKNASNFPYTECVDVGNGTFNRLYQAFWKK